MTDEEYRTKRFLEEMTELSRKYQIGIAGPFDLFDMEPSSIDGDQERIYRDDGRGKWEFV